MTAAFDSLDLRPSERGREVAGKVSGFVQEFCYPAEERARAGDESVVEELKGSARERGLWNLFLPGDRGAGLDNLDYAHVAELTGRSVLAPEAMNCSAPDTGNMETFERWGDEAQKQLWLEPLLEGEIRSAFAMTEPEVASSDPTGVRTRIRREGDEYVIAGHKWWISNAPDPRCRIMLVFGITDPSAEAHRRASIVLVPRDTPGVRVVRQLTYFGYSGHSAGEVVFENARVPASNLLAGEGDGFKIAQARLGPGRLHHCARAVGMAERALGLACARAAARTPFGKPLAEQGVVQNAIAESRIEIEQTRLLVLRAARAMDESGAKEARHLIAAAKVAAPDMACRVIDRAIQIHGAGGLSEDFPLAHMYAWARALRIVDGPDDVHKMALARHELKPIGR